MNLLRWLWRKPCPGCECWKGRTGLHRYDLASGARCPRFWHRRNLARWARPYKVKVIR